MVKVESGCVSCGLPCWGTACPNYQVLVLVCDRCHDEVDELYEVDGEDLCEDCLKKEFRKDVEL